MRNFYPAFAMLGASLLASSALAQAPATPNPQPSPATPPLGPPDTKENPCSKEVTDTLAPALCGVLGQLLNDPARDAALFDFSYGEPSSPVLPLIGVQGDQITRVENLRRFGLSLLTGMESGETGPGAAIDLSPFWVLTQGAVSLADYRAFTPLQRVFARTKIAAAASSGNEARGVPSSLVFSFSSSLLDAHDPLTDRTFDHCVAGDGTASNPRGRLWPLVDQALEGLELPLNPREANAYFDQRVPARMEELRPQLEAAYKACADETALEMNRRQSLDVGAGFRLTGDAGHLRSFEESGVILWATYSTGLLFGAPVDPDTRRVRPFEQAMGLQVRGVVHARYTIGEDIYDQNGVRTGQANSALLVAGLESVPVPNRPDTLRWSLQAGWTRQDAPNAMSEDRNYWRFLGIARYRLREGLWLNGTFGRVQGRGVESDNYVSFGISIAPGAGASGIDNYYRRTR